MERKRLTRKPRVRSFESIEFKTLKAREHEFEGKIVIVIGKQVFAAENGEQAAHLLAEIRRKYPKKTPLATYVPKKDELFIFAGAGV